MKFDRGRVPANPATPKQGSRKPPSRRRAAASLLLVSLGAAALAASGGSASARARRAGGRVQVYEVAPSLGSNAADDVVTGAITDHGKDYEGVAGNGTINRIVLSKGSFEINTARMAPKPPTVNSRTCSIASTFTATVPIVKGTGRGAYAGISGTFRVAITEAAIATRRQDHSCNLSSNAKPAAGVSWTRGSGTVSFK